MRANFIYYELFIVCLIKKHIRVEFDKYFDYRMRSILVQIQFVSFHTCTMHIIYIYIYYYIYFTILDPEEIKVLSETEEDMFIIQWDL